MIKKYNQSKYIFLLSILAVFCIMLVFNVATYYTTDDYAYMYRWDDRTQRIENIFEIFPSMYSHAITQNGRVVTHFLVQLFLLMPDIVFDVFNALAFTLLVYKIYRYCIRTEYNVFMLWFVFAALWYYTPAFGQVYLWLDGSCNYLWAVIFCIYYIEPYIYFERGERVSKYKNFFVIIYVLAGILMGAYSETVSFAAILLAIILMILSRRHRYRMPLWMLLSTGAMIVGYILMIFSPGTLKNKIAKTIGLKEIIKGLYDSILMYKDHLLFLSIVFIVLLIFSFFFHGAKRVNIEATGCFSLSLIINCMHCVAGYYPERSMLACTIFLIVGITLLLGSFWNSEFKIITIYSGMILLLVTVWPFVYGSYDIFYTYIQCMERNYQIEMLKAKGVMDLELPVITAKTKYSSKYGLVDLSISTCDTWPNNSMSRYYKVNSIIGVK